MFSKTQYPINIVGNASFLICLQNEMVKPSYFMIKKCEQKIDHVLFAEKF